MVGGGSCYIDFFDKLVLDDFSQTYDAIPNSAAQKFGDLLVPELKEFGVEVKGIVAGTREWDLNPFWKRNGF